MYYKEEIIKKDSPFIIFGGDVTGKLAYDYLKDCGVKNIAGFCDNNSAKWNTLVKEIPVLEPKKLLELKEPIVVMATSSYPAIQKQLVEMGIPKENTIPFLQYDYFKSLSEGEYEKVIKRWYFYRTGKECDLEHPTTFNEKFQWMKLYDNSELKTICADKYLVRDYIKEKIGEQYLIPLIGAWDSFDEIDFERMPNAFALKANHGSGWNMIIRDKSQLTEADYADMKAKFDRWMKQNYSYLGVFEMFYRDIPPKIIAEEYIENMDGAIYDYKLWCFHGKVEFISFIPDRYTYEGEEEHSIAFFDPKWKLLPFVCEYPQYKKEFPKPEKLEKLIEIAEILSKEFKHVRVDLYVLNNGQIKFGELTFNSYSGLGKWNPPEYNEILGNFLPDIP